MKRCGSIVLFTVVFLAFLGPLGCSSGGGGGGGSSDNDEVLIANRTSGNFVSINIKTKAVTTYALPEAASPPEPMYISYSPQNRLVFIGDRGNNRLVVYNANEYTTPIGTVDVGAGVFHSWAEPAHNQLWVVNDIDKSVSVVDLMTQAVIATIVMPTELASGKPHDIIVDPNAPFAFVVILGINDGANDVLLKYSTETFTEVGRVVLGDHTHVALSSKNNLLYVPSETENDLVVLDRTTLEEASSLPIPNTHGAALTRDASVFFTTNFLDGGTGGLISINASTNTVNSVIDTPFSVPHNLVITPDQQELFMTHSGKSNDSVSIYNISDPAAPTLVGSLAIGINPFGIAVIPGN